MPIYVYQCRECGKRRDIKHGVYDEIPTTCSAYDGDCGGEIRKVIQPTPAVYHCGGFHNTDYGRR